jgi:hypothetical protein
LNSKTIRPDCRRVFLRERAPKNSERQLENTAQLLAVHFEQLLRDFEAVRITVGRQMQGRCRPLTAFRQRMSGEETHVMPKSKISAYTDLAGVKGLAFMISGL